MNKLTESVKTLLETGHSVSFGRLTVCDLSHYINNRNYLDRKFQVDSDDGRFRYSAIYSNIDIAIDKFLLIRSILETKKHV